MKSDVVATHEPRGPHIFDVRQPHAVCGLGSSDSNPANLRLRTTPSPEDVIGVIADLRELR